MSKVGKWESGKLPLRQFLYHFPIQSVLHLLHHLFILKTDDGSRCCRLRTAETVHELLRLELVGQLAEALTIASSTFPHHKFLVLVGKVVVGHLAEEELLAFVLYLHCQSAETLIPVIHRQTSSLLPLLPVKHQDKG